MSFKPLYQNEILFHEMHKLIVSMGYHIVSIVPQVFDEETWELIQVDCVYSRNDN